MNLAELRKLPNRCGCWKDGQMGEEGWKHVSDIYKTQGRSEEVWNGIKRPRYLLYSFIM